MIGFLNERSLEEHADLPAALELFLFAFLELERANIAGYRDSEFFRLHQFIIRFNGTGFRKEVRPLVRSLVFSNRYSQCWRPHRISDSQDEFHCENPAMELRDESLCEASVRKSLKREETFVLVSAPDSQFGTEGLIRTHKAGCDVPAELLNSTTLTRLRAWIAERREHYDRKSTVSPRDFQTVLEKNPARFRRTGKTARKSKRQIFEEIKTGHQYYVDDAHAGHAAHLEVFSRTGDHLGVADVETGVLDSSGKVEGRSLRS